MSHRMQGLRAQTDIREPFEEETYVGAIQEVWEAIKKYNPQTIGYRWDETNPRIQLEPIGTRGYMELCPVKEIDC